MKFPIGQRVRLIHTGQIGQIWRWLSEGMVSVRVGGDELPVFTEDIEPAAADAVEQIISSNKTSKNVIAQAKMGDPAPRKIMGGARENRGVFVAFEPILGMTGEAARYQIWLANDSEGEALFGADFLMLGEKVKTSEGKIEPFSMQPIGSMRPDELNDGPEIDLELSRISTAGVEPPFFKTLKIRAKNFFASVQPLAALEEDCPFFLIFETWPDAGSSAEKGSSLADFAKKLTQKKEKTAPSEGRLIVPSSWLDPTRRAEFEPEIDLHIEKLTAKTDRLQPHEIVQIQMRRFDEFIADALRLGMDQVFVIHGVGQGKLKNLIHQRLERNGDVAWFRNEWHKKYGYGATEVIFK